MLHPDLKNQCCKCGKVVNRTAPDKCPVPQMMPVGRTHYPNGPIIRVVVGYDHDFLYKGT